MARTFGHAVKWSFVVNTGRRTISTISLLILAALLGPEPFGVVAMGILYVELIYLFLDQGFSTTLVQRKDLEPEHLDSAFWMNIAVCLLLTGVSIALSGWWADVNDTPELQGVICALSAILLLGGLVIVQQAVLVRELDFKALAIRSNVAALLGAVCGVGLALAGAGVWALVAQLLVAETIAAVLMWTLGSWRPRFRFSRRHARDLIGFSTDVFFGNLGNFLGRRVDALLLGIFFGPTMLGLYRLADRVVDLLLDFTTRPVASVTLPLLSRLQHDRPALREALGRYFRTTLLLTVPAMFLLAATSWELVDVLGSDWSDARAPLRFLALAGIGQAIVLFSAPVLYALGRPRLRAGLVWLLAALSAGSVVIVAHLLESASTINQLRGVAGSRALIFAAVFVPITVGIMVRATGISLRVLALAARTPFAAGIAGFAAVFLARLAGALDPFHPLPAFLVAAGIGGATMAAVILLLERDLRVVGLRLGARVWASVVRS
jgi:PST family polysaccharide transporter